MFNERICGECRWHAREDDRWLCYNEQSTLCGEETQYEDGCEDFEEREPKW